MSFNRRSGLAPVVLLAMSLAGCALPGPTQPESATARSSSVAVSSSSGLSLRWVRDPAAPAKLAVELEGLDPNLIRSIREQFADRDRWGELFAVYAEPEGERPRSDLPALQGRYEILTNRVRFESPFPAQPGVTYRAEIRSESLRQLGRAPENPPLVARFRMPVPARIPKTVVAQIYPSASRLPENLLKFYVHFSGPMSRGHIYEHIQLRETSGRPVELPFLEIDEELWDRDLTRLTLIIDPGRIKRGVTPLEEIGPAIALGRSYVLEIDRDWLDASGARLKRGFRKEFTVLPPDRNPPDPATWKIQPPKAGSRRTLAVRFPEPMDHALALRLMRVVDADHRRLVGQAALSDRERQWTFTPDEPWTPGKYQIVVSTLFEDLAGNSLGRRFEVDVFERIEDKPAYDTMTVPFEVAQP